MTALLIGVIVGFIATLAFVFLPILQAANKLIMLLGRFVYVASMPEVDDEEMQQLLNRQFFSVFKALLSLIFWLLTFILVAVGAAWLLHYMSQEWLVGQVFEELVVSGMFLLGSLAGMIPAVPIIFFVKRKQQKTDNNSVEDTYPPFAQFLHYVFLGSSLVAKLQFNIWRKRVKKEPQPFINKGIQALYVSGLARAGTTVLMQTIGQDSRFSSLSYNDLPLLFLPTDEEKRKKTAIKEVERTHGDGVMHSLNSYEALEEPFWRNFQPDYIKRHELKTQDIKEEVYARYTFFRNYFSRGKIYLSKNNNHLLRAGSLHAHDRAAGYRSKTIIPFRNGATQAKSLFQQHQHLATLQQESVFVKDYMDMLVHHEFGLGRKQTVFDSEHTLIDANWDEESTWLEYWYRYYDAVLEKYANDKDVAFICYERFCDEPVSSLTAVYNFLGLEVESLEGLAPFRLKPHDDSQVDDKYKQIYNRMLQVSINK